MWGIEVIDSSIDNIDAFLCTVYAALFIPNSLSGAPCASLPFALSPLLVVMVGPFWNTLRRLWSRSLIIQIIESPQTSN